MNPRDTTTGMVLENMLFPALDRMGYKWKKQAVIGVTPMGKGHRVDVLATSKEGENILISLKWQQSSGTAEEKVPYEVIKLIHAVKHGCGRIAYLVLAGTGWTMKKFYISHGLDEYIHDSHLVKIVDLETFITLANTGKL